MNKLELANVWLSIQRGRERERERVREREVCEIVGAEQRTILRFAEHRTSE
jgi:hypothetical protein